MLVLIISICIVALDQITKLAIRDAFMLGQEKVIIPGLFSLRFVRNTGAAWGVFQGGTHWLVLFSFVMLGVLLVFRKHFFRPDLGSRLAMGLILGGILGNLIDRVHLSFVVDFLDFYIGSHHFPSFNVADSAICVGVGLYFIMHVLFEPDPPVDKQAVCLDADGSSEHPVTKA